MPVLFIKNPDQNTALGVWQIKETVEDLERDVILTDQEKNNLESYKHENRKKHWLSYRALIDCINEEKFHVKYTGFGKPFLQNGIKKKHISITHSGDFSGVIINPDKLVGIDIERISKRIERVSSRFLSDEELTFIDRKNFLEHLTICWTAKEALFKISGNDCYDFKEQIQLLPFDYTENGVIKAKLSGEKIKLELKVYFEKINDYFLAYAIL